jgi:hypothetical protein
LLQGKVAAVVLLDAPRRIEHLYWDF